jgi:hypothetical protein
MQPGLTKEVLPPRSSPGACDACDVTCVRRFATILMIAALCHSVVMSLLRWME